MYFFCCEVFPVNEQLAAVIAVRIGAFRDIAHIHVVQSVAKPCIMRTSLRAVLIIHLFLENLFQKILQLLPRLFIGRTVIADWDIKFLP